MIVSQENEREMLRLIQQYLSDHGYHSVAQDLQQKSGILMEDTSMQAFRSCVIKGSFQQARDILKQRGSNQVVEYMLFEQEYLELLEKGEKLAAILLLQRELTPRANPHSKVYSLSQLILCDSPEALRERANWAGSSEQGRSVLLQNLQDIMPASDMLPPQRLEKLIK